MLYGEETGALNRAVKRNIERFPADFMLQLTPDRPSLGASSSASTVISPSAVVIAACGYRAHRSAVPVTAPFIAIGLPVAK